MPIVFDKIPSLRTPFLYVEFDSSTSASASPLMPWRTLLIGAPEKPVENPAPVRVSSQAATRKAFGEKSQLTGMIRAYMDNAGPGPEVWGLPVADVSKAGPIFAETEEVHYNSVVLAADDAKTIQDIAGELKKRGGPIDQADGVLYVATDGNPAAPAADSVEALKALGESFNSENVVLFPCPADSDGPEWAAALAGTVSLSAGIDPARPFQTLTVGGLRAAKGFTRAERESLLRSGVSTWTRSLSGDVVIERLITTYRKNAAGADDEAYLDLTTVLTLSYLRYSFRTYFLTKYPRHKLADDGVIVEPGQPVMTPKLARAEAISWYREMERLALVEGGDRFKDALVVERDARDRNRLNFLLPPDLINGFLVGAAKLAFTT